MLLSSRDSESVMNAAGTIGTLAESEEVGITWPGSEEVGIAWPGSEEVGIIWLRVKRLV